MDQTKVILHGFIFLAGIIVISSKLRDNREISIIDKIWVIWNLLAMIVYSF